MFVSHRDAGFLDCRLKVFAVARLSVYLQPMATKDLQVTGYGNVDVPVKRIAEERTALLFHADDTHWQPANFQSLADSAGVRKKLLLDIAPQNTNKCRALHFIRRDEATFVDCLVFNVHHVGAGTKNQGAGK